LGNLETDVARQDITPILQTQWDLSCLWKSPWKNSRLGQSRKHETVPL